jgi:hypothetical protein
VRVVPRQLNMTLTPKIKIETLVQRNGAESAASTCRVTKKRGTRRITGTYTGRSRSFMTSRLDRLRKRMKSSLTV